MRLVFLAAALLVTVGACGRSALFDDSGSFAAVDSGSGGAESDAGGGDPMFADSGQGDGSSQTECRATCAEGCCDATGRCVPGTSTRVCGASGARCFDCGAIQQTCDPIPSKGGACAASTKCGAGNCDGCCDGDVCVPGLSITNDQCGAFGQACTQCAPGDICKGGCFRSQLNCGPSNCDGCCEAPTICATGIADVACGSHGMNCTRCAPTEGTGQCIANPAGTGGACTTTICDATTCRSGCCSNGVCLAGSSPTACGNESEDCRSCAPGEACVAQKCVQGPMCSPQNCAGCCGGEFGNTCVAGNDAVFGCGHGGFACVGCDTFHEACVNGTCVFPTACSPSTCHGCCYGNVCAEGDQQFLCGAGGALCQSCATTGQQCVAGGCL